MSDVCMKCDRGKPREPTQMLGARFPGDRFRREAEAAWTKCKAPPTPQETRGPTSPPR
jgi:hypothetical protein